MRNLIFVTGLRKSGTSMVRGLLDGHPQIFMFPANEFELFHYSHHVAIHADKYRRENSINRIKETFVYNSFIDRLNNPEVQGDFRKSIDVEGFRQTVLAGQVRSYPELIELCFSAMAENCSYVKNIGEMDCAFKCVLNEEYLPEVLRWYPSAKMIYVLRNPYGHFNSIRNSMRKGVSSEGQTLRWWKNAYPILGGEIRRMRLSYNLMEKWQDLYPENFYVLVYDRLLGDPDRELDKLAGFLDIQFDPSMLEPTVGGELWGGNSWKVDEFKGIDKRPLTHWQEEISLFEIRLINEYFPDVFEKYEFVMLPSRASILRPNSISERPVAYFLNRLLLKAPSLFGGVRSY